MDHPEDALILCVISPSVGMLVCFGGCLLTCDPMDRMDHPEDSLILCVISPSV